MFKRIRRTRHEGRRGAVVPLVAVAGPVLLGFAALTIDLGQVYVARTQLQQAADAAALAAASVYFTDAGLQQNGSAISSMAMERAGAIALNNRVLGSRLILKAADVTPGQHDFADPAGPLLPMSPWNAVQVTARRTSDCENGPVSLFFARIWGWNSADLVAAARAAVDDRMERYVLEGNTTGTGFMPLTIPMDGYFDMFTSGGLDLYSYDSGVHSAPDGIPEVQAYPWKWTQQDGSGGSGNFGILDMNRPNNGAAALSEQISNGGASAADVQAQFGVPTLTFYDAAHTQSPITYPCSGTPGMKASIEAALAGQIGKVCALFLNNGVSGQGQNATYSICGIVWARIMAVDLSGGPHAIGLVVQPVGHTDSWVLTSQYARSTSGTAGRITLVQ
jgi:hypothetical protein